MIFVFIRDPELSDCQSRIWKVPSYGNLRLKNRLLEFATLRDYRLRADVL